MGVRREGRARAVGASGGWVRGTRRVESGGYPRKMELYRAINGRLEFSRRNANHLYFFPPPFSPLLFRPFCFAGDVIRTFLSPESPRALTTLFPSRTWSPWWPVNASSVNTSAPPFLRAPLVKRTGDRGLARATRVLRSYVCGVCLAHSSER